MADTLLATCYMEFGYDDFRPLLEIYRSDTGRIYGINMDSSANGKKIYGSPKVVVKEIKTEQQEYTSPSMMYTGMSSGGVGVGQATYYPGTVKTKLKASGKGYISISIGISGSIRFLFLS